MEDSSAKETFKNNFLKLIFELIGTMFFTYIFNVNTGGDSIRLLFGLWVLMVFGLKISGAHYNPAISFAVMVRREIGNFPRLLALLYMVFQLIGAFLGALLAWFINSDSTGGSVTLKAAKYIP
jgi:aquaporin Z